MINKLKTVEQVEIEPLDLVSMFVDLGYQFAETSEANPGKKMSLALCLPRIEYAAVLIGLGILKQRWSIEQEKSQEKRLMDLIDHWVCYEPKKGLGVVGILEFDKDSNQFKIRHFRRTPDSLSKTSEEWRRWKPKAGQAVASWTVLQPKQFARVHPAGSEFDPSKPVGTRQTKKIVSQNSSIVGIGSLIGADLTEKTLESGGERLCFVGNKSRIQTEISSPLLLKKDFRLEEVLRPDDDPRYELTSHCSIRSHRSQLNGDTRGILFLESCRNIGDLLATTRASSRIILLARNLPDYEESASLLLQESSIGSGLIPLDRNSLPSSIPTMMFAQR